MTPNLPLDDVLGCVSPLVGSGAALHWLRPAQKAPASSDWSNAPRQTLDTLRGSHRENANIGIRLGKPSETGLGHLYLIDLDVRDESQADAALAELRRMWPEFESFPYVVSGSGGSSRHYYFTCDQLFRSRKLARSKTFSMVWDDEKQREVKKNDWEIELFGTGKQAVIPPSIHPDTGEPYKWGREIDTDLLGLGLGPVISGDLVKSWGASEDVADAEEDEDDLFGIVKKAPIDLDEEEVKAILADLPDYWPDDREAWVKVGTALHHQYEGGNKGFTLWCEWSEQSEKYDQKDQERVWTSFKGSKNPVRMATLIQAANQNKLAKMHAGPEDEGADPLLAELLGDVAETHQLPKVKIDENWTSYLQITEDGNVKSTLPNIQLIVANDVRTAAIIARNEFSQETVLFRSPGTFKLRKPSPKPVRQLQGDIWKVRDKVNGDTWDDRHDYPIRTFIEAPQRQGGYGIKVSDRDMKAAVEMAAEQNAFHPVTDYLERRVWDGVPRVETLFVDYLGCDDTAYHRAAAKLTLLGAVARVFEPGHKFDFVPILEGSQGKGKSTFIRTLGHCWSVELSGDFHDTKEMVETMQGAWVLEIPELQGFSKADTTILKAFISKTSDKVRLSYDRRARVFLRQCIFIGSTNDGEYLRDTTGGRRFWPIACKIEGEVDNKRLRRNLDQLWAEATHLYKEMRAGHRGDLPLYLADKGALEEAEALQDSRRVASAEEITAGEIQLWLDTPIGAEFDDLPGAEPQYRKEVCIKEIWCEMWNRDASQLDQRQSLAIGKALRMIDGWEFVGTRKTEKYGQQKVFRKVKQR